MGLDFGLIKVKKGTEPIWDDNNELAYGRKSWELAQFFNGGDIKYSVKLTPDKWNDFIKKIEPIGDKLEDIWDAFDIADNLPDDYPESVFGEKEQKLIAEYELWYNRTWEDTPTLGYYFSVGYMLSFWEAKDIVSDILKDDEYDLYTIASY
jgi:hypothetical protein